jgi:hypothetical protein
MIGAIGKRKNGVNATTYNREVYPELTLMQCLTQREVSLLKRHLLIEEVASEKWLAAVASHIEICEQCRLSVAIALDLEVVADGLYYESMHSSYPPNKSASVYCKPNHEEALEFKDITDWEDIR